MDSEPPLNLLWMPSMAVETIALQLNMLDWNIILQFVVFLILLGCSALISGSEVALFSLSPTEVNNLNDGKSAVGSIIARLVENPKKLLATILISNNLVNISIILLFVDLGDFLFGNIESEILRMILDVGVVTFMILLCGEIVPKIYANRNNILFSKTVAYPIYVLDTLFTPLSIPMKGFTSLIHNKLGKQSTHISVGQLSQALELASSDDTTKEEKKILESIVSFGNTETRQVMVPRIDIFALSETLTFKEVITEIVRMGYSRIPVYNESLDDITGIIYIKDLLSHLENDDFDWLTVKRKAFFVPENKKLDDLLSEFQEMKIHLAVVVDEYGGTCGIITLEDIIEEIVGNINDEFDDEDVIYSQIDKDTYIFEGKTVLKDFYRIMQLTDEEELIFEEKEGEAETLAGFLLEIAGDFPQKGVPIVFENYQFTVQEFDKKRIKQIKIHRENNA
ncbi:Gliding motility-associated protein GldE [Capnocytophaga canis]|uniref:Gliding motility-associated protein GldE n=2 Tax=Capnocytophaga canis TaxID=1848903 RepID=A0A0B7HST9_9FLAO|nr:Gliding motility-associated protein GldE [Capnocytophaga canis]CEN45121.1 Gliding motility-associated protein GldE [Capnocytophaga canis]